MVTRTLDDIKEDAAIAEAVQDLKAMAGPMGMVNEAVPVDISDPTTLVPVYVTSTGEPRMVPIWTIEGKNSILARRNSDGTKVFSHTKPIGTNWKQGEVKCLLHPEHERREELTDEVGLGGSICMSGHLASGFSLRMHMQNRHKSEWATIEDYDAKKERDESRAQARVMAEAARVAVDAAGRQSRGKAAD